MRISVKTRSYESFLNSSIPDLPFTAVVTEKLKKRSRKKHSVKIYITG